MFPEISDYKNVLGIGPVEAMAFIPISKDDMASNIQTITLKSFGSSVNCYLLKTDEGFILVDTGWTNKRSHLEKELESAGCFVDNLVLIILTHGDFDHSGNCAYLKNKYQINDAMHVDDARMVEQGNMFWNRKKPNFLLTVH